MVSVENNEARQTVQLESLSTVANAMGCDLLIPTHVHTREELNLWEQENILEAVERAERRGPRA